MSRRRKNDGAAAMPDETTILRFRHLLEKHNLAERIFALVNERLDCSKNVQFGAQKKSCPGQNNAVHAIKGCQQGFGVELCKPLLGLQALTAFSHQGLKPFSSPYMKPLIAKNTTEKALTAGLLLCLFIAFCRGFYMPTSWCTNYWLLNFFDGFYRRALLGTLLYPFGDLRLHYHFVAIIATAASAALLYLIVTRLAAWRRKQTKIVYIYIWILPVVLWSIFFQRYRTS